MPEAPRVTPKAALEPGMRAPLSAIDVVAFASELFAFATLAIWGFALWPFPWNIVVGICAPLTAIFVWALFVSPRAMLTVHPFVRAVVELLVYVSATIAWWGMGLTWVGVIFGVVAVTAGVLAGRRRLT